MRCSLQLCQKCQLRQVFLCKKCGKEYSVDPPCCYAVAKRMHDGYMKHQKHLKKLGNKIGHCHPLCPYLILGYGTIAECAYCARYSESMPAKWHCDKSVDMYVRLDECYKNTPDEYKIVQEGLDLIKKLESRINNENALSRMWLRERIRLIQY